MSFKLKDVFQVVMDRLDLRGIFITLAGLFFIGLCATPEFKGVKFDLIGRVVLGVVGAGITAIGLYFIIRNRPTSTSVYSSACPIKGRKELSKMSDWTPALQAKDILMIGINLNIVVRHRAFFENRLRERKRIRMVIADFRNNSLLEVLKRGVEEKEHIEPDFSASFNTIAALRDKLPEADKHLLDLRVVDYVPTLSFQVVDGTSRQGRILVELTPNKVSVPERPHFILEADNLTHKQWYDCFRNACERIYNEAQPWFWNSASR